MKDLISVIVPIYNGEKYLARCINSVLNQTNNHIEILLINDGSKDNTDIICKDYAKLDNRIVYIKKENSGVAATRNIGIKYAKGNYLFFLDADDYIDKDLLQQLLNHYEEKQLISSKEKEIYQNKEIVRNDKANEYPSNVFLKNMINGKTQGYCWGYLYNTDICKKISFDESLIYCEDMEFLFHYIIQGDIKTIKYLSDECYYNYFYNTNSVTVSPKNLKRKINSIFKALDSINNMTNYQYAENISNKKIRMLEGLMQKCLSTHEMQEILQEYTISDYTFKSLRYKVFTKLYQHQRIKMLKLYYFIRKIFIILKLNGIKIN